MTAPSISSSSAGVSSLLSKYQTLSSCIASTRSEIQSTETEIQSMESSITSLQQQHQQMDHDLKTAYQESNDLNQSLANTLRRKEHQTSSQTEIELQQQIRYCEKNLRREKMQRAEQKREFLQICREFRISTKRSRISFRGFEKDPIPFQHQDDELASARSNERDSDDLLFKGQTMNSQAKERKKILDKEGNDRTLNLQQQMNHLKEIRRDVQEKERELQGLEQSTKEFEEINDGFARSAMKRKQQNTARMKSTPRAQYASSSSVTPSPSLSNNNERQRSVVQNPYKKKNTSNLHGDARSSLAKQYPHRAGRIRVDRQFSTGLSIDTVGECDWDGYDIDDDQRRDVSQNNGMGRDEHEFGEDSYSLESDGGLSYSHSASSLGTGTGGGAKGARRNDGHDENGTMSSESSDDDDDVLTFTPFNPRE